MKNKIRRLPAEWEEQDGVLLAWPHDGTDWAPCLHAVQRVTVDIAREITRFEQLVMVAPDIGDARRSMGDAGVDLDRVRFCSVETNDTWARDFGPITVMEGSYCSPAPPPAVADGSHSSLNTHHSSLSRRERPVLLDFGFNGWGLKFPSDLDNQISRRLSSSGVFGETPLETMEFVLEGGSIESDGRGTILTTARCLLSPNRNPSLSRESIESFLCREFGAERVLWIENGELSGDDTDAHVDTLARFCPDDTIVYTACDDPADEHYEPLRAMEAELKSFRTSDGRPYRLIALPWPVACRDDKGSRLPATYANFLIINGAVLVPAYGSHKDQAALEIIGRVFADRRVVSVACLPLLTQGGSLHCFTMQIPKGVLA